MSTACDFVDLAQNGFCTRPVAPLQGSLGHRSCASPTVSRLRIHSQNRFSTFNIPTFNAYASSISFTASVIAATASFASLKSIFVLSA